MSNAVTIRYALLGDVEKLIPLMRDYYRDDGLSFDESGVRSATARLLTEPQWGCLC